MASTPRNRIYATRVTDEEAHIIEQRARKAGLKPGEYMRARALADDEGVAEAAANYVQLQDQLAGLESAIGKARRMLGGPPKRRK